MRELAECMRKVGMHATETLQCALKQLGGDELFHLIQTIHAIVAYFIGLLVLCRFYFYYPLVVVRHYGYAALRMGYGFYESHWGAKVMGIVNREQ